MQRVAVTLDPAYDVVVGEGVLADAWLELAPRRRVALVSQPEVLELHGAALVENP